MDRRYRRPFRLAVLLAVVACVVLVILPVELKDKIYIFYLDNVAARSPVPLFIKSDCSSGRESRGDAGQRVVSIAIYGNFSDPDIVERYLSQLKETCRTVHESYPGTNHSLLPYKDFFYKICAPNRLDRANLSRPRIGG